MSAAPPHPVITVLSAQAAGAAGFGFGWHVEGAGGPLTRLWHRCDRYLVAAGAEVRRLDGEAAWLAWWEAAAGLGLAVEAALALQAEVGAFRERLPIAVTLRIGIGVGSAPISLSAGQQVCGPTAALAERLAQSAPPGGIVIVPVPGGAPHQIPRST